MHIKLKNVAVATAFFAAFAAPHAEAASASVSYSFDQLAIKVVSGNVTYQLGQAQFSLSASVGNNFSFGGDSQGTSLVSLSSGSSSASAAYSSGLLTASASSGGSPTFASAHNAGTSFSASGIGVVVFSLPYTFDVSSQPSDRGAAATVSMQLLNLTSSGFRSWGTGEQFSSSPGQHSSASGVLNLAYLVDGSTPANFQLLVASSASANGAAPVPEPKTYAMLLAGLGLVAFSARHRIRLS